MSAIGASCGPAGFGFAAPISRHSAPDPIADVRYCKYLFLMRAKAILDVCAFLLGCEPSSEIQTAVRVHADEGEDVPNANTQVIGQYLCTVAEKASIESSHMEGAGPPKAVLDNQLPTRFRVSISADVGKGSALQLVELPYDGPDRDPYEWHTQNSVIHSVYVGDGTSFNASDAEAKGFFELRPTIHSNSDGTLAFYHSGFAWAGGEDAVLSVRWGRCKRD